MYSYIDENEIEHCPDCGIDPPKPETVPIRYDILISAVLSFLVGVFTCAITLHVMRP